MNELVQRLWRALLRLLESLFVNFLFVFLFEKEKLKNFNLGWVVRQLKSPIFWLFFVLLLALILSVDWILKKLTQDDFLRSRVRLKSFLGKVFYGKKIIIGIYDFQLAYHSVIEELKNSKGNGKDGVRKLLEHIQTVVGLATSSNISVNVKVFVQDRYAQSGGDLKNQRLITFERVASTHEKNRITTDEHLPERANDEEFIAHDQFDESSGEVPFAEAASKMKDWINNTVIINAKQLAKDEKTAHHNKVNSAYCYVMGSHRPYFISNNLKKDEKEGYFYSNSNNWKKYYNSLAVFRISTYNLQRRSSSQPNGLLIVDSYKTNIFESGVLFNLLGYFACRLHPVLELVKENERKSAQKSKSKSRGGNPYSRRKKIKPFSTGSNSVADGDQSHDI